MKEESIDRNTKLLRDGLERLSIETYLMVRRLEAMGDERSIKKTQILQQFRKDISLFLYDIKAK